MVPQPPTPHSLQPLNRSRGWDLLAKGATICLGVAVILGLAYQSSLVREGVARSLGCCGPRAVPRLLWMMQDSDPHVGVTATAALVEIGPGAVPPLIVALHHPDPRMRMEAARALGDREIRGTRGREAVEDLLPLLNEADPPMRITVIRTLTNLGSDAQAAVPALQARHTDSIPTVRRDALLALLAIAGKVDLVKTAFIQSLDDPDVEVRLTSCSRLSEWPMNDPLVVQALVRSLSDSDTDVRGEAAEGLANAACEIESVIAALRIATQDAHPRVRREAEEALTRLEKMPD